MAKTTVSIRLVPTALIVDAASRANLFNDVGSIIRSPTPENINAALIDMKNNALGNLGNILVDVVLAGAWTKFFHRTPGVKVGNVRISL